MQKCDEFKNIDFYFEFAESNAVNSYFDDVLRYIIEDLTRKLSILEKIKIIPLVNNIRISVNSKFSDKHEKCWSIELSNKYKAQNKISDDFYKVSHKICNIIRSKKDGLILIFDNIN